MNDLSGVTVLLYDGLCGFCDRTVQFILARDKRGGMKFAPLQGEYARDLLARHPNLATVDSLMLVTPAANGTGEHVVLRSAAVVAIGRYLGGPWRLFSTLLQWVPTALRDLAYDGIARRRLRIFGRRDACRILTPAERIRFID
ncbi:MAG: DUF393 domain-containing protein [Phycisphaerae bacterium]|nr:DUF393 domain-containing protein [Gemmatimonadaceae bacterium]